MAYYRKAQKKATAAVEPAVRQIRSWSNYQQDLFKDIESGVGNTQVDAKAGSGKTSSICEGFWHLPHNTTALMCAFAKPIEIELSKRAAGLPVLVKTIHGLGNQSCRRAFPKLGQVDKDKLAGYIKAEIGDDEKTTATRESLLKIVPLAKGYLAQNPSDIDSIMDRHGVDAGDESREAFITMTLKIMDACKKDTSRIDFDDMVWLPYVLNLPLDKYKMVFVDEAQDLNLAQIEMMLRSCDRDGRIISVGDEFQAIYGFRGADSNAIQNIVDRCQSKRMPLSVTYRCAKNIVKLAQEMVPDLEAAPDAIDGKVDYIGKNAMESNVRPGDFILSRTNAPLIGYCLNLLRAGIPANIQGRDVGDSFLYMIKRSGTSNLESFRDWVEDWRSSEVERLLKKKRDSSVIEEKAECLNALCEGSFNLEHLKDNIKKLFHDGDNSNRVILSTTHKAKGLERDRVFLLSETFKPGKGQEEKNIYYVALTWARKELYMVAGL